MRQLEKYIMRNYLTMTDKEMAEATGKSVYRIKEDRIRIGAKRVSGHWRMALDKAYESRVRRDDEMSSSGRPTMNELRERTISVENDPMTDVESRKMFCLSARKFGYKYKEIASYLGMSMSRVEYAIRYAAGLEDVDKTFRRSIEEITSK